MPHSISIRVLPEDIDDLDHANNIVYLRWIQEAARSHSTAMGFSAADYKARGQVWVVTRHEIDYVRPALLGDELRVETRIATMGMASCERRTRIFLGGSDAGLQSVIARAVTRWAYIDLSRGRPVRIPEDVRRLCVVEPDE